MVWNSRLSPREPANAPSRSTEDQLESARKQNRFFPVRPIQRNDLSLRKCTQEMYSTILSPMFSFPMFRLSTIPPSRFPLSRVRLRVDYGPAAASLARSSSGLRIPSRSGIEPDGIEDVTVGRMLHHIPPVGGPDHQQVDPRSHRQPLAGLAGACTLFVPC